MSDDPIALLERELVSAARRRPPPGRSPSCFRGREPVADGHASATRCLPRRQRAR